jgi:DNA-binding winged helix-turn-helix (wHTH) protein/tetratricopeptide (TPR) repeat protein
MAHVVYAFGDFLLDPLTRELRRHDVVETLPVSTIDCLIYLIQHRDRSVGRDELASAVWGRTDVSEASLTQGIMRLRRVVGDASCIRTTPRLGYRWMSEPTIERDLDQQPRATTEASAPTSSRKRRGLLIAAASALLVAIVASAAWWWHSTRIVTPPAETTAPPSPPAEHFAVMVVPAGVEATDEWVWLRLGLMDLIANELRDGGLTTTPSETTVGLINAKRLDADKLEVDPSIAKVATLLVKPSVSRSAGLWNVKLAAHGPAATQRVAEAQDRDVLVAARRAADTLLVKLGHTPLARKSAPEEVDELAQRIAAAGLAGQLDVAREIAEHASPEALARPDIALALAYVDFYKGDYEASRERCENLLDQVPADRDPHMRALVVNQLGVINFREMKYADASANFDQAVALLKHVNDPKALAAAYTGQAVVAVQSMHLDAATASLGQARLLHEMSNDAYGMGRVDLNLGAIAMLRGQPLVAARTFEQAADQFEVLAALEARDSALRSLAEAYAMLLEHDKALAATERLAREDVKAPNTREQWWNMLSRADALSGVGRLDEAAVLLQHVRNDSDATADASARSEADAMLAGITFMRGDFAAAAKSLQAALTPMLESTNDHDYFDVWFKRIRAMQSLGDTAGAAADTSRLRQWAGKSPSDRWTLYLLLLEAGQDQLEGRAAPALVAYADALARAEKSGIPEDILAVASPYANALVNAGKLDEASAVAGRVASWSERDMRSALVEARVYDAMHNPDAADRAMRRVWQLSGERAFDDPRAAQAMVRPSETRG